MKFPGSPLNLNDLIALSLLILTGIMVWSDVTKPGYQPQPEIYALLLVAMLALLGIPVATPNISLGREKSPNASESKEGNGDGGE